jgi:hypothetical protein
MSAIAPLAGADRTLDSGDQIGAVDPNRPPKQDPASPRSEMDSDLFRREADEHFWQEGCADLAFIRHEGKEGRDGEKDRGDSGEHGRDLTYQHQPFAPFRILI